MSFTTIGRTRRATSTERVDELVEMLLFTLPGERVMRPDLGTPILGLLFEGLGDALAATVQISLHAALQQWLGDLIEVRDLEVEGASNHLLVTVTYALTGEVEPHRVEFRRDQG